MKVAIGGFGLLLVCLVGSCTTATPKALDGQNVRVTRAQDEVVGCRNIRLGRRE